MNVSKTTFAGSNATNIHIEGLSNAHIDGNVLTGADGPEAEDIGIYTNNSYTLAENNICANLSRGIKIEYNGDVKIGKNLFDRNEIDVSARVAGKTRLEKNTFIGTERIQLYIINHSLADISHNNFINSLLNTAILIIGTFREDINEPFVKSQLFESN